MGSSSLNLCAHRTPALLQREQWARDEGTAAALSRVMAALVPCYRRVMRENGVKVLTVRDILSYGVEEHIGARVELEDVAMQALTYDLDDSFK